MCAAPVASRAGSSAARGKSEAGLVFWYFIAVPMAAAEKIRTVAPVMKCRAVSARSATFFLLLTTGDSASDALPSGAQQLPSDRTAGLYH